MLSSPANTVSARCIDDVKAAKSIAAKLTDKAKRESTLAKLKQAEASSANRDEHGCKAALAEADSASK
jgi:DNA-binding LacI/PurR family transcriptional regulator